MPTPISVGPEVYGCIMPLSQWRRLDAITPLALEIPCWILDILDQWIVLTQMDKKLSIFLIRIFILQFFYLHQK